MRAAWLLVVVAGCGDNVSPPDAPEAMPYQLYLHPAEPTDRPVPATTPLAYIDGVATNHLEIVYPNEAAALGATHRVELRYGEIVVASMTATISLNSCLDPTEIPIALRYMQTLCVYDSGDLRFGSDRADGRSGTCIGDGFCMPSCGPAYVDDGCMLTEHCTTRVASMLPFASHLGCAPVGTKQLGDTCTFTADVGGAYDDCARGLVCVAGRCRQSCGYDGTPCATCSYVPGYPPELRVCM